MSVQRARGPRRRMMNEINVVPYIDVMLVLLVIFMVTAPLVVPGQIELPSVAKSSNAPATPVEIIIGADAALRLREGGAAQIDIFTRYRTFQSHIVENFSIKHLLAADSVKWWCR